jgi:hypothetical protein
MLRAASNGKHMAQAQYSRRLWETIRRHPPLRRLEQPCPALPARHRVNCHQPFFRTPRPPSLPSSPNCLPAPKGGALTPSVFFLLIAPFPPPSSPAISPGGGTSARHSLVSLLSALHDSLPPDESATFLSYLATDEARVCAALAQHVRHARQLAHSKRSC